MNIGWEIVEKACRARKHRSDHFPEIDEFQKFQLTYYGIPGLSDQEKELHFPYPFVITKFIEEETLSYTAPGIDLLQTALPV
jgi:hypothetical protein